MKKMLSISALLATALMLGACYESTEDTLHEPAVYKGGTDPLLQKEGSRQEQLRKRFELVQLDR